MEANNYCPEWPYPVAKVFFEPSTTDVGLLSCVGKNSKNYGYSIPLWFDGSNMLILGNWPFLIEPDDILVFTSCDGETTKIKNYKEEAL